MKKLSQPSSTTPEKRAGFNLSHRRKRNLNPVSEVCQAVSISLFWPTTASTNYRKCVSNFPSTRLANRQWPFNRPIMAPTQLKKDFGIVSQKDLTGSLVFLAATYGEHTESALPLLNLLDVLTVHNVYRCQILKFTYLWHKGLLPKLFSNYFQYASNVHKYNTKYASKQNLFVKKSAN